MKYVRGFLFSLAFAGLAFLAFHPHVVVKIQDTLSSTPKIGPFVPPEISRPDPPKLPDTPEPDTDNLPRLKGFEAIAKTDAWIGDAPCSVDIFDAPLSLPGLGERQDGPVQSEPITASDNGQVIQNRPTFLYKSENGITLKLVEPAVEYYDVSGLRFRDVRNDIFDRKPLEKLRQSIDKIPPTQIDDLGSDLPLENIRVTRAADIFSPSSLSYTVSGSRERYRLLINQTVMTSAFLVTLPRWKTYGTAAPREKAKWDDFFCNVVHHELGHLRIRLDILAGTLDGYASLPPAHSAEEMKSITIEYRTDISDRVQDRQDAYHIYNGGGIRRGMTELPYDQLPFPWLEPAKTAVEAPTPLPGQQLPE